MTLKTYVKIQLFAAHGFNYSICLIVNIFSLGNKGNLSDRRAIRVKTWGFKSLPMCTLVKHCSCSMAGAIAEHLPHRVLYSRVLGTSMGFLGGPTDRVGDSFNLFMRPLSKLCVSDVHLCVKEKHASAIVVESTAHIFL